MALQDIAFIIVLGVLYLVAKEVRRWKGFPYLMIGCALFAVTESHAALISVPAF